MSAFDELVRPSLARIGAPGDGYATDRDLYWGSGFFIAPGWLLTCAHVVGKGGAAVCRGESAMRVTWQERTAAGAWVERTGTGTAVLLAPTPETSQSFRDPWPFPDLALVNVAGADDVRCLWLSDREPGARAPIELYGWSVQTGELGIRHGTGELAGSDARALLLGGSLPIGGLSGGPVLDRRHGSVIGVIKGRRREEGVAVPVAALHELLDLRGGPAVLHEVLRAHDLHHLRLLDDPSPYANWTTLQATLPALAPPASGISADLRARLYGHLAELPPPAGAGEIVHLVEEVKEQVRGERLRSLVLQNVRTWREGAGLLYGLRTLEPGGGGTLVDLDAVLLYAAKVVRKVVRERPGEVDPARLGAFAGWLGGQADGHRNWAVGEAVRGLLEGVDVQEGDDGRPATPEAPPVVVRPPATRTDVLVKVGPPMYDGRYPWSVQLIYDGLDVTPVDADDRGVRVEELAAVLREPLARALSQGDHGEHLAALEVFLPRKLFDLPVDEWQLLPGSAAMETYEDDGDDGDGEDDDGDFFDERSMPLGMRRTVVIRDARRNNRPPTPEWRRRWRGAVQGPLAHEPLHGRAPADGHPVAARSAGKYPYYGALSLMDDPCVPVYCGPVGSGEGQAAMRDALMAGHSVVLWRRDRHDHDECKDFHRQAAHVLGMARHAEGLHGPVRDLRIRLYDPESARAQGLRGKLAVLFDPPDRPPYGTETMRPPPLAAPGG
ncbi:trypsin-like peptidase domain-containing protein [Streptomyces sp. Ag109_G2-15]|uniref:VMAP-C domain-containing protein n=1 Tax=Streptomyces sp. Ag109_G2-15 TaxID=1938850 RepID=UPI000BCA979E|nr:trypsin-like peptidase domain-containing protein [Streptomyces sp. Ag109_G2-15]SOD83812.1 Trypsin-like peptidase domain-containing protein [Streptomyces sp. Ag109_G2-15]